MPRVVGGVPGGTKLRGSGAYVHNPARRRHDRVGPGAVVHHPLVRVGLGGGDLVVQPHVRPGHRNHVPLEHRQSAAIGRCGLADHIAVRRGHGFDAEVATAKAVLGLIIDVQPGMPVGGGVAVGGAIAIVAVARIASDPGVVGADQEGVLVEVVVVHRRVVADQQEQGVVGLPAGPDRRPSDPRYHFRQRPLRWRDDHLGPRDRKVFRGVSRTPLCCRYQAASRCPSVDAR